MKLPFVRTPLWQIEGVWVKMENFQYTGSIKVRPAYFMLWDAMRSGVLKPGDAFVEATSGNTGIALAHLARMLGLRFVVVLPEDASRERKLILRYLGAEVVEVSREAVIDTANEIADSRGIYMVGQHSNPMNPLSHKLTTAPEILEDMPDVPATIVAGVGTGGTITGLARYFKELKPDVRVVGVRPVEGEVIEGLSRNYLPAYDMSVVDEEVEVPVADVRDFHRHLARKGYFLGFSSAANILVAMSMRRNGPVVTVAPDGGDRYISKLG